MLQNLPVHRIWGLKDKRWWLHGQRLDVGRSSQQLQVHKGSQAFVHPTICQLYQLLVSEHFDSISIIIPTASITQRKSGFCAASIRPAVNCKTLAQFHDITLNRCFDWSLWTCFLGTFPLGTCCITVFYTPSYCTISRCTALTSNCTILRCTALTSNCNKLQRTVSLFCPSWNGRQSTSHKTEGNSLAN